MLIKEKKGNIKDVAVGNRLADYLTLEWYETNKRILHKRTEAGKEVILKFLREGQQLTEGDIVFEDDQSLIIVQIKTCEAIVLSPRNIYEASFICYEIGNKHLPLFFENDQLLIPYEAPIFKMLAASGMNPVWEERKLLHPLKTSVTPHGHAGESKSLFSRILQLTTASNDQ
jgi:urease accessory protein